MQVIVKQEFKKLIPALLDSEYEILERSIIKDGCQQPLLVWDFSGNGKEAILIDGHNRYEICAINDIPYDTKTVYFETENDAKEWMLEHQLGRRNLSDYNRTVMVLTLESVWAAQGKANQSAAGGNKKALLSDLTKAVEPVNTRAKVAEKAGVSTGTVAKVKAIEEKATPEVKKALSEGKISINKAHEQVTGKVKAKPEPEYEEVGPDENELRQAELEEQGYQEFIKKTFADDPSLAAALEENKRVNAELAIVKIARDGYMNQCNAYIKQIKSLQRKLDKAGVQL